MLLNKKNIGKLIFVHFIFFCFSCKKTEKVVCDETVEWQEVNAVIIQPHLNTLDTLKVKKSRFLVFTLTDCMGAGTFKLYDNKYNLITEGEYSNSLDLLKEQVLIEDLDNGDIETKIETYYKGVCNGQWKYYNDHGDIKRMDKWEKGFLKGNFH